MSHDFLPFRIQDKEIFQQFLPQDSPICDKSFTSLFCWQEFYDTHWAIVADRLVVRCRIYGERRTGYMILPDIQTEHFPEMIEQLEEDLGNPDVTLINLSEKEKNWLQQNQLEQWGFDHNRDYDDYLYERARFESYSGKRLAAKRNHVNKFKSLYSYTYEPLTAKWFEACLKLEQSWHLSRGEDSRQATAEQRVIRRAFEHMDTLNILGGVLLVNQEPIAFTYGSPLDHQTFCIHIEKADISYEGAYPMMAQLFAQHLPTQYLYLDREEDLGLPGLRKSKESYQPIRMEQKIQAFRIDETRKEIVKVWQQCFGDEVSFIHAFLARYYFQDTAFLRWEDGHLTSTCFLIICDTEIGKIGYLYAIATFPEHRHQGYAAQLVSQALAYCRHQQLTAAALIPADEALSRYYARMGFSEKRTRLHFSHDLDLGTGRPDDDLAQIIPLKKGLQIPDELNCNVSM